jgi:GT2 family glycosyltransferase
MNRQYAVVILNRYPEYAKTLLASIQRTHKSPPEILVVCDRHMEKLDGCQQIYTTDDFIYSRNANRGIDYFPAKDIILMNDDMEVTEKDFFHKLSSVAWKFPKCGLVSPVINGGVGNPLQAYPLTREWDSIPIDTIAIGGNGLDSLPICFPCVYITRRLIKEIGLLDENFTGYGEDDVDYCIRARNAGYYTMITRALVVTHGSGGSHLHRGYNWSCSFARELPRPSNMEYLKQKYSTHK